MRRFHTRARSGSAGIELVIVAPVLILLMFGLYDLGNIIQQDIWLEQAVRAGGIYALTDPTDTSAIESAVVSASGSAVTADATASSACSDGSTPSNGACSSPAVLYQYVTITASLPLTPFIVPLHTLEAQYVEQVP